MIVENEWDRRLDGLISSDLRLVGGTEGGSGAIRRAFSRSPVGSDGSEGPGSSVNCRHARVATVVDRSEVSLGSWRMGFVGLMRGFGES